MLLEVILALNCALSETELGSSLVQECILGQAPSEVKLVLARARVIRRFLRAWVLYQVNVNLLHLLAGYAKRVRLIWLIQERLGTFIGRDCV